MSRLLIATQASFDSQALTAELDLDVAGSNDIEMGIDHSRTGQVVLSSNSSAERPLMMANVVEEEDNTEICLEKSRIKKSSGAFFGAICNTYTISLLMVFIIVCAMAYVLKDSDNIPMYFKLGPVIACSASFGLYCFYVLCWRSNYDDQDDFSLSEV